MSCELTKNISPKSFAGTSAAASKLRESVSSLSLSRDKTDASPKVGAATKAELWSARIGFFTGGFTVASWAPLIPFVQSGLELSPMLLGTLLLGLGVGSFVGMPLAGTLSQRIGCRNAIGLSGLLSCLLLVCLTLMPSYVFECAALFLYGITLGCLEVSVNIYGTHLEKKSEGRIMSGLHAAYSIGEVVSAGLITLCFVSGLTPLMTITSLMTVLAFVLVAILSRITNEKIKSEKKEGRTTSGTTGARRISGSVLILASLCAVIFLTEGAMLDWSAIYLRDNAGVPQEASAFGYTLFVIAMALSRLIGDSLTTKIGAKNMLVVGSTLILLSLLALVLIPTPIVAFAALFIMGLGMANLAPVLISAASRTSTMDSVKAITAVTTVGYGGLLAGPALIGAISSAISLQGAFLFICLLLVAGLVMINRHQSVFK